MTKVKFNILNSYYSKITKSIEVEIFELFYKV